MRRASYLVILAVVASIGGVFTALNSVAIPNVDRTSARNTFICLADVEAGDCGAGNAVAQLTASGSNRIEVSLDEISPHLINAVVAAEDRSFFKHNGVDAWGIVRAVYRSFAGSASRQGGSTITQQYVKMRYLNNEGTLKRKFTEAGIALKVEQQLSKRDILEAYLNEAPFGRGAVGAEAAARTYFSKPARELTIPEAAYLAGLLRAPSYADEPTNPDKPAEAREAKRRRRTVLDAMYEMGYITAKERDDYDAVPFEDLISNGRVSDTGREFTAPFRAMGGEYIVDWVVRQLLDDREDQFPVNQSQLYGGGLRIYLEVDPTLQYAAFLATKAALDEYPGPSASMMAVDRDGSVLAMIGGQDWASSKLNLALGQDGGGSGRQPGSTMKPVALAAYVEAGYSIKNEFWSPEQVTYYKSDGVTVDWEPRNYDGRAWDEPITVEEATWWSSNTVYAQIMKKIGFDRFQEMAYKLGIITPQTRELGAVLGTTDTSLLEMTVAYSTLANHGERRTPHVIRRIEDASGKVLYDVTKDAKHAGVQALEPGVADTVAGVLTGTIHSGTGANARIETPAAGKTGTTSDYKDAWFAGFSCGVTAVFWMGYPSVDPETGTLPQLVDPTGKSVTGGSYPAYMWKTFMSNAVKGRNDCEIAKPDWGSILEEPDERFAPTTTTTTTIPTETSLPDGEAPTGPEEPSAPTTTAPTPPQQEQVQADDDGGAAA